MPQFFIDRPIFAWVVAIFITLFGIFATVKLPAELYPDIAPPAVTIFVSYPGSTPKTMNDSVVEPLERELSGVEDFLYMESSSDTSGTARITITFMPGTNHKLAVVDVQNKVEAVKPRLPEVVRQLGVRIQSSSGVNLMTVTLLSPDGKYDQTELGDYFARHVSDALKRLDGVGRVNEYFSPRALRIWVDPAKLTGYGISVSEIIAKVRAQNVEVSPGILGDDPIVPGTRVSIPLMVHGQLESVDAFKDVILRANPDGSKVVLSDVANVTLGRESYNSHQSYNGAPTAVAGVELTPGANAVSTASRIYDTMDRLAKNFPDGIAYTYAYDNAPFVGIALWKVFQTFLEALALVFIIMFLFLQNWRATIIPAIVVPIALLGSLGVIYAVGYSLNVLTSFGLILAIGIVVDDAIVVTENVERLMAEEHLSARDATKKGMKEITGAVVGITLVLTAVFGPIALASGAIGKIYRQFSLSIAVSILFSAFLALSLTPALCATLLKPHDEDADPHKGSFGWFNRGFDKMTGGYTSVITWISKRGFRTMIVYLAICAATAWMFMKMPTGFLPTEDQGSWITNVQLDAGASSERTLAVLDDYREWAEKQPGVDHVLTIQGFGFSGSGPNVGLVFTVMKPYEERKGHSVFDIVQKANIHFSQISDGQVISVVPPPTRALGNSSGFAMRLEDHQDQGQGALLAAAGTILQKANQSPMLQYAYMEGLGEGAMINIDIDRKSAQNFGVSYAAISSTLSAALGTGYINDFPNAGYLQQVRIQAKADSRMNIDQVMSLPVRANNGDMVPLSSVAQAHVTQSPLQLVRYNGAPAARISGVAAPGYSSGQVMAKMQELVAQYTPTYDVEWTGLSYQEQLSGNEAPALLGLSLLVIFLVLAALYESWSIPLSVILVVPLGIIGALIAASARGLPDGIFFKIGVVTLIGLTAKNAILIVEFAKQLEEEEGMSPLEAAIHAAKLRLRPILMTSLAFGFGVLPMALEGGAAANSQHAIGTSVVGGMISGTVLAVIFVPVFYVVVRAIFSFGRAKNDDSPPPAAADEAPAGGQV